MPRLTRSGLVTYYALFFIHLGSRRVRFAGCTPQPDARWMQQQGRNFALVIAEDTDRPSYLIHDRDPLFTTEFLGMLKACGVKSVKLPPRSPNLNAYAERFVRSIKESCLERMVLIGESSLHRATSQFVLHYHQERNHQGLDNKIIRPEFSPLPSTGPIRCRKRLGGMLNYYYPEAA